MIAMLLSDVLAAIGYEACAVTETESETIAAALLYKPDSMTLMRDCAIAAELPQLQK